jgi:hypothetical protein
MQKKKTPSDPENDAEENTKALRLAIKVKKLNPHERVLERIGYYLAMGRIRLGKDPLGPWPPSYPKYSKWDLHDGSTVQLYGVNEWNVLNWFIQLAKKGDLTKLSPADILALQEESQALQAKGIPELTTRGAGVNEPLSVAELKELQTDVQKHVDAFLATKTFTFTDFTTTILIERDPEDERRLVDYEFVSPLDGQGLRYLFATLLRRVRLPIERCPQCQQIFLKPRKDAEHCSRECQYLHYAQKKRGHRPPGKRGRPRKHHDPQLPPDKAATKKKGAKSHGLK